MGHASGPGWRRGAGLLGVVVGSVGLVVGLNQVPSSATFAGGCTDPAASSGSCTIAEPAGDNPATHGTVTYRLVGSSLRFDFAPVEDITAMVVCVVVNANQAHPFIPTTPTSCTDTSSSKRYDGTYQDPYTYDLTTLAGWSTGQSVYFAIGLEQAATTTYAVGGVSTIAPPRTATTEAAAPTPGSPGPAPTRQGAPTTVAPSTATTSSGTPSPATTSSGTPSPGTPSPGTSSPGTPTTVTPTTATPTTAAAQTVAPIPSSDGAPDLSGVAPVGALLVVVGCRLLRVTAGPPSP